MVYLKIKEWAQRSGLVVIAGHPPSGSDHLPVVAIRSGRENERGNSQSEIPDLIIANAENLVIIECKPRHDEMDVSKLSGILMDSYRISALREELYIRSLLKATWPSSHLRDDALFQSKLRAAIAHSGESKATEKVATLLFKEAENKVKVIQPSDARYKLNL